MDAVTWIRRVGIIFMIKRVKENSEPTEPDVTKVCRILVDLEREREERVVGFFFPPIQTRIHSQRKTKVV